MPTLSQIRQSNSALTQSRPGLVGVFVGGTSGIGEATANQLATYVENPTIFLIGQSEASGVRVLEELKQINPDGAYHFLRYDLSLLHNVDKACNEIKKETEVVDILFMTPGYLAISRQETREGLEKNHVLRYYARMRFVLNLREQLLASKTPRVVSVLAAGKEGRIEEDNLDLEESFSVISAAMYAGTMNSLAMEALAAQHPSVSFVHVFPGVVRTNLMRSSFGRIIGAVLGVVARPVSMSAEESGERNLFIATSAAYAAALPGGSEGVALGKGVERVTASTGADGKGSYILNYDGEDVTNTSLMVDLRNRELDRKVWAHTEKTFGRVFAT